MTLRNRARGGNGPNGNPDPTGGSGSSHPQANQSTQGASDSGADTQRRESEEEQESTNLLLSPETDLVNRRESNQNNNDGQQQERAVEVQGQFDDAEDDPIEGIFDGIPGWYRIGGVGALQAIRNWLFFFARILPGGLLHDPKDVWQRITGKKKFCISPRVFGGPEGHPLILYQSAPGYLHVEKARVGDEIIFKPVFLFGFFHTHDVLVRVRRDMKQ